MLVRASPEEIIAFREEKGLELHPVAKYQHELPDEGLEGGEMWTDAIDREDAAPSQEITVPADETMTVRAYVVAPRGVEEQEFAFVLATSDAEPESDTGTTRFTAPEQ